MIQNTAFLVKTEGLNESSLGEQKIFRQRLCEMSGFNIDEVERVIRMLVDRNNDFRRECELLTNKCRSLETLVAQACCPGNRLFSQVSLDEFSDDNQVPMTAVVTGLGGDYVDAFPLPPGKKIRLRHLPRPGYEPQKIAVDFSLAGGGDNYLDLTLQLHLLPGGQPNGKPYGPTYRGNQFLNKDGSQIHLPFPPYRGVPLVVGSSEVMEIEITHTGAVNNLNSAFVTLFYDAQRFFNQCRTPCDPTSCG